MCCAIECAACAVTYLTVVHDIIPRWCGALATATVLAKLITNMIKNIRRTALRPLIVRVL